MVLFFGFGKATRTFFPTWKLLNILDAALFFVSFVIKALFLLFCGILTCNCISCAYLVAVNTVNRPSTRYCWFLTAKNLGSIFHAMISTSQHKQYHFSILETSKYVRRHLVCCLFVSKCVLFWFQPFSQVNTSPIPILLQFTL